ncbi:MAG: hypothetical protein ABI658_23510 [Acidimicrobiales bacterium]
MCALAHVLEREGIATVTLVTRARLFPEQMRPPRALYCDFPLGRPLGKPRDAAFQRKVLEHALALLDSCEPVLADFPEVVDDDGGAPLACAVPPRVDAGLSPAVGEARGLRAAFDRASGGGITSAIDPGFVEDSLAAFERVQAGTPWRDAGFPERPQRCTLAIRGYYEQAAVALQQSSGGARAAEAWFVDHTIAGGTIKSALAAMRASGEPGNEWGILLSTLQDR